MTKIIQRLIGLGVDLSTKKALKRALKILGLKPENIDTLYIELKNNIHRERFKQIPKKHKLVFLPQCLRDCNNCKAKLGKYGYECKECSDRCKVRDVKRAAEKMGYRVFIVPGGSMVAKVIKEYKPKAVFGVGCPKELIMFSDELPLPAQGIALLRDGCVNTDVDVDEVIKILK